MTEQQHDESNPEIRIRAAAQALATARARPCVALVGVDVDRDLIRPLRRALASIDGDATDVLLTSHGGQLDAAYLAARELKRRFAALTVYVPLCAKSAASLICLAADELVLGDLGELGPLDPQRNEMRAEDTQAPMSALLSSRCLRELNECALQLFGEALDRLAGPSRLRPYDAAERATRLAGRVLAPLYARLDLVRLGEQAHGVQLSGDYVVRVLRRFRSDVDADTAGRIAHALVTGYASHGFVLDREELGEIGVAHRAPDEAEAPLLDEIADALLECGEEVRVCGVFTPEECAGRDTATPALPGRAVERAAQAAVERAA